MMILGFDTAVGACSAALWRDGDIIAHRFAVIQRGHAEALVPMLEEVRAEANGIAYQDIDYFAVTVGPGTFTGIRVGLATARGLGLATRRPVIGITTLEAIALGGMAAEMDGPVVTLAVIDARRNEVYAQAFTRAADELWPPSLLSVPEVVERLPHDDVVIVGTGSELVAAHARASGKHWSASSHDADQPDAANVASIAARRIESSPGNTWPAPAPLYIRPPDARLPGPAR